MKIPKYIEKLIGKRKKLAAELITTDYQLSEWLEKNEVDVEDYDTSGGCEMYVNPWDSANRIKQAIENK